MNSTKKLVSVVVPVYNAEKYLWDTIWNIRSQSYKDIEILLINDASKDKSEEICKELAKADERIRVISHPHNMGAGGARNTGIIAARGEYLIFADADDDCDKDMIKEAVDKIENDGTDWVIWGIKEKIYDTKGKQLSERDIVPKDGCFTDTDDARMQIIGLEKSTLFGYPYNKLYKIHIIKACGIRFNKDVLYEDFVFNDLSLGEIAGEEGISRQGVADMIKRCNKKLESFEDKLHLVAKFVSIRDDIERIHALTADFKESHNELLMNEIESISNQILEEL